MPEYHKWYTLLNPTLFGTLIITLLCLGVTLSKHIDRLCKFTIVSETSTMFFAAVDANMKVIAGIGSFIFFDEVVYWPQVVGFGLIFGALVVMYEDKKMKMNNSSNSNSDGRSNSSSGNTNKNVLYVPILQNEDDENDEESGGGDNDNPMINNTTNNTNNTNNYTTNNTTAGFDGDMDDDDGGMDDVYSLGLSVCSN